MSNNRAKYQVIKQYLRSILDIRGMEHRPLRPLKLSMKPSPDTDYEHLMQQAPQPANPAI